MCGVVCCFSPQVAQSMGATHISRCVCWLSAFCCAAVVQLWQPCAGSVRQQSVFPCRRYSASILLTRRLFSALLRETSCCSRLSVATLKRHGSVDGHGALCPSAVRTYLAPEMMLSASLLSHWPSSVGPPE